MKKFCLPLLLTALLAACSEEIDMVVKGDPLPVVYCLLDPGSSQQYVRLGRTFLTDQTLGITVPDSDSTVWNRQYEIYMEAWTDGERKAVHDFTPYDGVVKDTGFFPQDNLRLFKSGFLPKSGWLYHLYVFFPEMNRMVSAQTMVHSQPQILDPMNLSMRTITFSDSESFTIRWQPGENCSVYQFIFRMHYEDSLGSGKEFHYADYSSKGYYEPAFGTMCEYRMPGRRFYTAMSQNIPVLPGISRKVISIEFIMLSGGLDLGFHFRSHQNTGDAFSNLSEYSNIRNGLGVFSSIGSSHVRNLRLSRISLHELAYCEITGHLGFKNFD